MNFEYDDIINLPHHVSTKRPQMSIHDRAAQFSPFAALTGFEESIAETSRLTEQKIELDNDMLDILDKKFQILTTNLKDNPEVTFRYFKQDKYKDGGAYVYIRGIIKTIDYATQHIIMSDGTQIPINCIIDITSDVIKDLSV